jgi:hypothetical protein
MPEIASGLQDITSVKVVQRTKRGEDIELVNQWLARAQFPSLVSRVVDPDSLGWLDYATWRERDHECHWRIEPLFLRDSLRCDGIATYDTAIGGRGSRVTFEGSLDIDLSRLTALVGPMRPAAAAFLESIATTIIPRNFRKTLDAACLLIGPGD